MTIGIVALAIAGGWGAYARDRHWRECQLSSGDGNAFAQDVAGLLTKLGHQTAVADVRVEVSGQIESGWMFDYAAPDFQGTVVGNNCGVLDFVAGPETSRL